MSTSVAGAITKDTVWTAAGSPYEVTATVSVPRGLSLVVEPGVEVRFARRASLETAGALRVVGTAEARITFTGTSPEPGWWGGVAVSGDSGHIHTRCELAHVVIQYAGYHEAAGLELRYATASVSDAVISDGAGDGIRAKTQGTANLTRCSLVGNAGHAVLLSDAGTSPTLEDITGHGNGTDAVVWGQGKLTGQRVWPRLGLPYVVTGDIEIADGASLLVEPGVQIAFAQRAGLSCWGGLRAVGTKEAPITFTGTSAEAGWWSGLSVSGDSGHLQTRSELTHVLIQYAGYHEAAGLRLRYATLSVSDAVISDGGGDGILAEAQGTANLTRCSLVNNAGRAVLLSDAGTSPTLEDITGHGNGTDAVVWGLGKLSGQHVWPRLGLPYVVTADLEIDPGASLVVEPGVRISFAHKVGLSCSGALRAVGTAEAPITFTGTSAEPGWWSGLAVSGESGRINTRCELARVLIQYAGYREDPGLRIRYAALAVSDAVISDGGGDGIRAETQGTANLTRCSLVNNASYAVLLSDASTSPALEDVTGHGNGTDAVAWGRGTLTGQHVWPRLDLPYVATADLEIAAGGSLRIEPGVQISFARKAGLRSSGSLRAMGTAGAPIVFGGLHREPGWWSGLALEGRSPQQISDGTLDHVVIESAGNGGDAACCLKHAQLHLTNSTVSGNSGDGIVATNGSASGSVIQGCRLVDNGGYAVRSTDKTPGAFLVASNNWWGDPTGPATEDGCNPTGRGSKVGFGVACRPFLTSEDARPVSAAPSEARIIAMRPRRWFTLSDGMSRIWFDLTLRDGDGTPLPDRALRLVSDLGRVVDGGVTDADGHTLAYLTSSRAGEAQVFATLHAPAACEYARSPSATVKFLSQASEGPAFGSGAAPYFADGIEIEPLPVTRGTPTTLRARVENPGDAPISLDVSFGIAQLGIGLTFGPIGTVEGLAVPAHGDAVAEVPWTPPISGHFCLEAMCAPSAGGDGFGDFGGARAQRNIASAPGPLGSPDEKERLREVQAVSDRMIGLGFAGVPSGGGAEGMLARFIGFGIPKAMFQYILDWNYDMWIRSVEALGGDPPRRDYDQLAGAEPFALTPLEPDDELPAERARVFNEMMAAFLAATARLRAAAVSLDRYGGASAAGDGKWAALQASSLLAHKQHAGSDLLVLGARIQAVLDQLAAEGLGEVTVDVAKVRAYQERLRDRGLHKDEIAAAQALGLTAGEIEQSRLARMAMKPVAVGLLAALGALGTSARRLGEQLAAPADPPPPPPAGETPAGLARVYDSVIEVRVGNPTGTPVTMALRVRRIDLPPDWMVTVEPPEVQLDRDASTAVAVRIAVGLPAVQGTRPRVAVEGFVDDVLISGVVVDVVVPRAVAAP